MLVKKKILFILHMPPPTHGSSIIGKYINESKIINNQFDTRYINLSTSKSIKEIGKFFFYKWVFYFLIILKTIIKLIKFKPNIVYLAMTANGIGFYKDVVIAFIIKLSFKQLVIHFHNKGVNINQNKFLDNLLYKFVFNNTKVILLSEHLYSDVKKYVRQDNALFCPNGIKKFSDYSINKRKSDDKVQLLFLSNLIRSKGVYELLEALAVLKSRSITFVCNFVGGIGDISNEMFLNEVKRLNLQSMVNYLGPKYDKSKFDIYSESDIFVHPTLSDCFPLVLIEASQFRLPIVSTYEGGIPDIVKNGVNGFLVQKKDVRGLANKLELLIKDKNLRLKLGKEAYFKYNKEYTFLKFEENMYSILKSIN